MFKQHLEMIGRNESPSKKAKFWQSYVRSLKGSDDIRAHETPKARPTWRPMSSYGDLPSPFRSIYDEPNSASERITGPGYRYLPVHRDTYGYSPRAIYTHHYGRPTSSYVDDYRKYDADKAWRDHLERMKEIERRYPSRYGLYLKDKPNTVVVPLEYEPEDKPIPSVFDHDRASRARSVPPPAYRDRSTSPFETRAPRATSVSPLDSYLSEYDRATPTRGLSPTPVKRGEWGPRDSEVGYDADGMPYYRPGRFPRYNSLERLINPGTALPMSSITRDPFWYDLLDLRPFTAHIPTNNLPSYLRESYLSPVKRRYLWTKHPVRPFAHVRNYW